MICKIEWEYTYIRFAIIKIEIKNKIIICVIKI